MQASVVATLAVACARDTPAEPPEGESIISGNAACIGQPCGEPCQHCAADDPGCTNAAVEGQCDARGRCRPAPVGCGDPDVEEPDPGRIPGPQEAAGLTD